MRITTATAPARPDRPNEDFVAASNSVVVLLDGAGNPPGADEGCRHGVAWFTRTLGTTLLNLATDEPHLPLPAALRTAIAGVADFHRESCDLQHPGSPSATVVALRQVGDELDYLVLADSVLLLDTGGSIRVVTDDREARVGEQFRPAMDALPSGSPEHADELRRYVEVMRAYRNRPGGFWVASSEPAAADKAITGAALVPDVHAAVLLSDGASRLVDRFKLATWRQLVKLVAIDGPEALIDRVREAEQSDPDGARWPRGKSSDDATAAYVSCGPTTDSRQISAS
jgi:Protein phosphatase 2C